MNVLGILIGLVYFVPFVLSIVLALYSLYQLR